MSTADARPLLIIRPEPGASESAERARQLGLKALPCPLFKIEAVEWSAPDPANYDALLITSANAIRHAGSNLQEVRQLPVIAVGERTAEAARVDGLNVVLTGSGGVAELAANPEMQIWKRLLHLAGEHHKPWPKGEHSIDIRTVYRSRALPMDAELCATISSLHPVVALHSARAARHFAAEVERCGLVRANIGVTVISAAGREAIGDGWLSVETAQTPDDASVLALAARQCYGR